MKKPSKKSAPKATPKVTPKAARHPMSGWIIFDAVKQQEYEIDFVVDGVAVVTAPGASYQYAIPLDGMQSGELFKLFDSQKAFDAFLAAHYPKATP